MGRNLTIKEKKFISEYTTNGGNGTKAALEAYDVSSHNAAAAISSQVLGKPAVAEALKAELTRQGITLEAVISPVAKGLHATKKDGSDDFTTQLAAHDRAVKIMGMSETQDKSPAINFNIDKANFGGEFVEND